MANSIAIEPMVASAARVWQARIPGVGFTESDCMTQRDVCVQSRPNKRRFPNGNSGGRESHTTLLIRHTLRSRLSRAACSQSPSHAGRTRRCNIHRASASAARVRVANAISRRRVRCRGRSANCCCVMPSGRTPECVIGRNTRRGFRGYGIKRLQ